MAIVYRAYDTQLDVFRAIKTLRPELAQSLKIRERFQREARTMAKLKHPNIAMILDVRQDGAKVFMIMEEIRGGTLRDRLDVLGAFHPKMAAAVIIEVLAALAAAHRVGVVHRDIKPANVLLTLEGQAKVTDFGIARVQTTSSNLTITGAMMGTLAFMAPEQRENAAKVDPRADIYAVGATLYALATARDPINLFAKEGEEKNFNSFPAVLYEVTRKATQYDPENRFQSADEMADALRSAAESIAPVPDTVLPLGATLPGRNSPRTQRSTYDTLGPNIGQPQSKANETFAGFDAEVFSAPVQEKSEPVPETWSSPESQVDATAPAKSRSRLPMTISVVAALGLGAFLMRPNSPDSPAIESQTTQMSESAEMAANPPPSDSAEKEPVPAQAIPIAPENPSQKESPPAPAHCKQSANGTIFLNSIQPWSQVKINGKASGSTPWRGNCTGGKYTVLFTTQTGLIHQKVLTLNGKGSYNYCWNFAENQACPD
jgi:serine/threonine protein kinase